MTWDILKKEGHYAHFVDRHHGYYATVKWDGCTHFYMFTGSVSNRLCAGNDPEEIINDKDSQEDINYIHICDADEMAVSLMKLKHLASRNIESWDKEVTGDTLNDRLYKHYVEKD